MLEDLGHIDGHVGGVTFYTKLTLTQSLPS